MAHAHHQEDGWPLGLQPLNAIVGLVRNHHDAAVSARSMSFNTLLTFSPSTSTVFSSDVDTESTGSFFPDKSTTLGSLMGVSSITDLSGRSLTGRRSLMESFRSVKDNNNNNKMKSQKKYWLFSLLCAKPIAADIDHNNKTVQTNTQSLAHFLEVERKLANSSLYNIDGHIAAHPPHPRSQSSHCLGSSNVNGFPLSSCICGVPTN
ncbi:hypothetical protein C5167_029457 [Papaver somniferum]|uniref:uncharacterized protein At3g17950-like n=1 Tax=Papaver somniferum TaxID=3469 RepID=UPI000E6FF77F|nr:uncharacterized protein At3g17950-like [Papaver somniferum]RZC93816.1 hypothetical protein C5167_029457 [Papaver somniferum]